jgi:hypothetical protein
MLLDLKAARRVRLGLNLYRSVFLPLEKCASVASASFLDSESVMHNRFCSQQIDIQY